MRDSPEQKAWDRLEAALRVGTGHVVVTAPNRDDAARLVDAALEGTEALAVLRLRAASEDPMSPVDAGQSGPRGEHHATSDRHEALRELLQKARTVNASVFAVVEDADAATAEQLERIRMAVECVPDAIDRMRVVLIGTPQLDLTLREPAAGALASRVSTHVRLTPDRDGVKLAALKRLSALRLGAAGMVTVALASVFGRTQAVEGPRASTARKSPASAADRNTETDAAAAVSSARERGTRAPNAGAATHAAIPASLDPAGDEADVVAGGDSAIAVAAVDVAVPPAPVADTGAATDLAGSDGTAIAHVAAHVTRATSSAGHAAGATNGSAATQPADPSTLSGDAATNASTAMSGDAPMNASTTRNVSTAAAHATNGSASASTAPRLKQPVVMEAAVFKDMESAYSLQKQLAERVDRVLVTRLDGARGTLYSVRVVGLDTSRAVAHAEREIRTLGHRPVRLAVAHVDEDAELESPDAAPAAEPSGEGEPRTRGRALRPRAMR